MILVFITPIKPDTEAFYNLIPPRSCVHGFLFLGFTHIMLGIANKQRSLKKIKRNSITVVLIFILAIIAISETILVLHPIHYSNVYWNLIFDVMGMVLGLCAFCLLYRQCR